MKTKSLLVATLLITAAACSSQKKEEKPKQYEVMKKTQEETAEVASIDYKTRKMTLKTDDGPVTIVAPAEVQNFNQIEKGDTVVAQYEEALVYSIADSGETSKANVSADFDSAKPGETPSASSTTEVTAALEVIDIDKKAPSVTLKNAQGETETFKVKHPERLNEIDEGDIVNVKYSQAMAVKVEKKEMI